MDTLALLCNLHADGPATLQRLRSSGCRTLAELEALPPRTLAHVLGENAERARRFLREARLLAGRVDDAHPAPAEPDLSRPAPAQAAPRSTAAIPAPPSIAEEVGGPFAAGAPESSHPSRRELFAMQPLKEAVLRVWSEQDRLDPPHALSPSAQVSAHAAARAGDSPGLEGLDGCDALARRALAAAGVNGAAEFLRRDPLELAARTGLAYSALNRWRFLLRRAQQGTAGTPR
jgi:hypothetical protein